MKRILRNVPVVPSGLLAFLVGTALYLKEEKTVKEKYALLAICPRLNLAGMNSAISTKTVDSTPMRTRNPVETV